MHHYGGDIDNGEVMHVLGKGEHGRSLYCPLNFAMSVMKVPFLSDPLVAEVEDLGKVMKQTSCFCFPFF